MGKGSILVVDDDSEIQRFLSDIVLAPVGYHVLTASDGQEALEKIASEQPDVVLLDLMLPGVSGLDLLKQMQQENISVPVIVLTAYSSRQAVLSAFRLGARDFLQKPFSVNRVRSVVKRILTEERLRRERDNLTHALARANQRLQQQLHNWVVLNDIAQTITSTLEEGEIFRRVMANVNHLLDVEAGSLLLVDQETGELEFAVTLQGDEARFSDFRLKPGQGIAGWVAEHGRPLLIPDVRRDSRFFEQISQDVGLDSRSILCVPLKVKGQVIGVIEVINKRSGPTSPAFTRDDQELLTTLASWVAVAVENAQLNRVTQEAAAAAMLKRTVTTLAHHINNQLMAFSLELDSVEAVGMDDPEAIRSLIGTARRCIRRISAVVKALDRLEEIRTMPYVGETEMIDIEEALEEQLRYLEEQERAFATD
ncbi:MAG TPA: response regulator [Anaerolineae bacterium]|nr:response regulator [Anaerolineae bacterium]